MSLLDLQEAHVSVQHAVPFCTAATMHLATGNIPPPAVGGNCIFQLRVFCDLISSFEDEGRFLRDRSSPESIHYVRVSRIGTKWFYWDPYLLFSEPIEIPVPLSLGYTKYYKAKPIYKEKPWEIAVTQVVNRTTFTVEKFSPFSCGEPDASYTFDIEKPAVLPASADPFVAASQRPYLYLRLLDTHFAIHEVTFDTRRQNFMIERHGGRTFHRVLTESNPHFDNRLAVLAEAVEMDVLQFRQFFADAVRFHAELRKDYA